jgi:hypothetical protein
VTNSARLAPVVLAMLLLVAALLSRLGAEASLVQASTLRGTIGPGFEISLTFSDGSEVRTLAAGTYTVVVSDVAQDHNFHLFGPGVDQATSVEGRGTSTWTVTFRDGVTYQFQCDPHPDLAGRFDVGASSGSSSGGGGGGGTTPSQTTAPKTSGAVALTLRGTVGAVGKLKLTLGGKPVVKLKQGTYTFVVADSSAQRDFSLRKIGAESGTALTGVSYVGKRTVKVTLKPGQWKFYSGRSEAKTSVLFSVTK